MKTWIIASKNRHKIIPTIVITTEVELHKPHVWQDAMIPSNKRETSQLTQVWPRTQWTRLKWSQRVKGASVGKLCERKNNICKYSRLKFLSFHPSSHPFFYIRNQVTCSYLFLPVLTLLGLGYVGATGARGSYNEI